MKNFLRIGRDDSNDIIIREPGVSRTHAIITILGDQNYEVKDLGSTNGTYVNGQRITRQILRPGDQLQVASSQADWETAFKKLTPVKDEYSIKEEPFAKIKKTLSAGSSNENDIILKSDYVSSHHARISLLNNDNYYIEDLGSRNGTYVNGIKINARNFTSKDVIKIASSDLPANWIQLFHSKESRKNVSTKTFALPTMGGLTFVDMENIIYCEGASNQTKVYLEGNRKEMISRTLKECEEMLSSLNFFRIHKSYLINLNHVKKYYSGKDGQITLSNGITLPVSRNYKEDFLRHFGKR